MHTPNSMKQEVQQQQQQDCGHYEWMLTDYKMTENWTGEWERCQVCGLNRRTDRYIKDPAFRVEYYK